MPKRVGSYASNSRRVYKKRRVSRWSASRVRRASRPYKKSSVPRSPQIHSFSRMTNNFQISLAAGQSYSNGSILFQLDNLINYGEFTALFDQYKITKVDIYFKLHTNPYLITVTQPSTSNYDARGQVSFPTLWLHNDKDDSTAMTRAEFQERQRTVRKVLEPNKIVKWTCRPTILTQLYRTVATTGYAPKYGQFIDCAQPNVPHYCTKWGIDYDGYTLPAISPGSYGQDITVGVEMRYYFTCKDVR